MEKEGIPSVSRKEALCMALLARAGEMYGLELVEASEGRLKRGTIYVTLRRMADKGFVTSVQEDPTPGAIGLPRRRYRLTALGRRIHQAWAKVALTLSWEGA